MFEIATDIPFLLLALLFTKQEGINSVPKVLASAHSASLSFPLDTVKDAIGETDCYLCHWLLQVSYSSHTTVCSKYDR